MKPIIMSALLLGILSTSAFAGEWTGSIKIGLFQDETSLLDQVKVSMVDAVQIAEKALPGTVVKAELDKEDGYLVYSVELADKDGEEREAIIDPVIGSVLEKDKID
ncbi:MAG: PepSY domain-containing protein [Candidatus Omnitrophica bacterium]|nr:PepSY domain-containing protein [Candidatus Omnitrophota bacterium]